MQHFYDFFIDFHIVFSVLFLLIALYITLHSLLGWMQKKTYGTFANRLRRVFLFFLYGDLILGIILYFFLQKPEELISAQEAMKFSTLRFWAIQHFSNMIFVVGLSVIGSMFVKRTANTVKKYKYSFLYFGISTLIIIVSVGFFAIRK
ncbi:MAG: hypothetical protein AB7S69_15730 [Salinivirgaceae bacterium]|jgi:hypothetical protein